jgi:UDP-N-acetylglucosamine--dolichyl-phosphate N-acetylglucosaminephosphotransferase
MNIFSRPEAFGVVTGCIFLIAMFLFIPIPFGHFLFEDKTDANFPHNEVKLLR